VPLTVSLARASFPSAGGRGLIVLLTDGHETRGYAAAAVKERPSPTRSTVQVVPTRYTSALTRCSSRSSWRRAVAGTEAPNVRLVAVSQSTLDSVKAKVRFP